MKTVSVLFLSCFVYAQCGAETKQVENELPPPFIETRTGSSLSAALKTLKGESGGTSRDVVLLDDNTIVELIGPFGDHDAFRFFMYVPCKEAVPLLIDALAGFRTFELKDGKRGYVCTWACLRGALMAQSGQDFRFDQSAWRAWWESTGKDQPDAFFEANVEKMKKANQVPEPTGAVAPVAHR